MFRKASPIPVLIFLLFFGVLQAVVAKDDFLFKQGERILFFGDSITFNGEYGRFIQAFITEKYPNHSLHFAVRGAHGDTAKGSLNRVADGVVPWKPDWILVNFGINDCGQFTPEEFIQHYTTLLDKLKKETGAKLAIVSPIYRDSDQEHERLTLYPPALKKLAKERGDLYIPLYESIKAVRPHLPSGVYYAVDGVHPNSLGTALMALAILDGLGFPFDVKQPFSVEAPIRRVIRKGPPATLQWTLPSPPLPIPVKVSLLEAPLKRGTIPPAAKPITVDGRLEEWTHAPSFRLDAPSQHTVGMETPKRQKPKVDAWIAYDADALYFAARVEDDVVRHRPNTGLVNKDCVELFLDLRSAEEKAKPDATAYLSKKHTGVAQFMLAPASQEVPQPIAEVGSGDRTLLEGIRIASSLTENGYALEFSIPAARFPGGKITPGEKIGFDFSVNDLDETDLYHDVIQLRWSGSQRSSFSSDEWGELEILAP